MMGLYDPWAMLEARKLEIDAKYQLHLQKEAHLGPEDKERHRRHGETLHRLLAQVEAAMSKVKDGTYGSCDACQGPIAQTDLAHDPTTTACASCSGRESSVG